jgi:GNAT superfamily N-acetyltransferase
MEIRLATLDDAPAISQVVRRSIRELCGLDHHDDPEILALWLANKTPEDVALWLASPANINLVAVEVGTVLAAGCVTRSAEVILNYVSPEARFRGVSRMMMSALEAEAKRNGAVLCRLDSTLTARRFYRTIGWAEAGPPSKRHGMTTWPMSKALAR